MAGDVIVPVLTDILKNVWIVRNPSNPSESVELRPFSVPLVGDGKWEVKWSDSWL